ncbi:c-type cytochrome [Sulfitobacter sp. MF3-043]|uniref:c-type cytochrome n=1 Tax=Sulfitobacter sediminivivens TaxID=3252902 RepID=UPI003EBF8262
MRGSARIGFLGLGKEILVKGRSHVKHFLVLVSFLAMGSSLEAQGAGQTLYVENCVSCHGVTGRGNGPVAAELVTKPADLTQIAARRDGVWPMLEVMSIIDGYSRNALPREDMPVFEHFLDDDMVEFDTGNGVYSLVPSKLIDIVNYLETLQDPAPTGYVP